MGGDEGLTMADTSAAKRGEAGVDDGTYATRLVHQVNNPLSSVMANVAFAVENLEALRGAFSTGSAALRSAERARLLGVIDEVCAVLDDAFRSSAQVREIIRQVGRVGRADGAADEAAPQPGSDADRDKIATPRRGRVLVIDDEPAVARSVERILRGQHDVRVETDPQAALALLLAGEDFDVVFCDLMMPPLNGMGLYDALADARPEMALRVVFLTGGATTTQAEAFVESTERPVMTKPFTVNGLRAMAADYVK